MTKMIINITISNWKFENPFNNKDSTKKKSHHSIRKNDDFFRTDNSISGNFFFAKNEFSSSVEVEFEIVNITFRRMEKVVNTAN